MMKIGSLFDGSGGFPLAASMCGIEPVWASEVEPYPIAVTRSRFPNMKHLGSVTDVKGNEVEPVDVITFGSPCQDLSVAGKRAGLKHTENGDDETTRSGLFMEAIRIIKEMREATNGEYPRFAVWENVPGAFSSNKGDDFRIVLEEFIRISEPSAVMPEVPKAGWPYADVYCGDGWSLAYRVLDAQYWGVPQRRRRIYLVADFRGQCAGKVSFEREGLRGYFETGRTPGQAVTGDAESCVGTADCPYTLKIRSGCEGGGKGALVQTNMSATLATNNDQYLFQPVSIENHPADSRVNIDTSGKVQTLTSRMGTGGGNVPMVMEPITISSKQQSLATSRNAANTLWANDYKEPQAVVYEQPIVLDRAFYNQGQNAQYEPQLYEDGTVPTLVAKGPSAVAYWDGSQVCGTLTANNAGGSQRMPDKENFNCVIEERRHPAVRYIVRRLTPTECARLQGFPDEWGHPDIKESLTDEEYEFWLNVRNTHAEINGKAVKDYTREQMLTWYNKLHTDSSEYKMWGNGIALPCALYVMQGVSSVLKED